MELIVKVVAPGEWYPLGPRPGQNGQGGMGAPPIGLGGPDPLAMGAIVPQRDGQIVLGGKKDPNQPQVAQGDKVDPKLQEAITNMKAQLAAKAPTIWEDALKKMLEDPKTDHTGLVIATADFLVENRQFKHA